MAWDQKSSKNAGAEGKMNCPLCYGLCSAQAVSAMPSQLQWDVGMCLDVVAGPWGLWGTWKGGNLGAIRPKGSR